ncbi:hypothetical protein ISX58_16080 [Citrobacter amalonaticus]|uniref:hypothetical protein n=1 Tax=Citrobacter amalonaticus TaxID=35703 RepID=UPI00188BDCE0|nr:hypothetical protein [Citrobacter amalonaticus]QPB34758.1 hypothetical protein ISX58_16080 [Citrobacter amalonaticus]
MNIKNLVEMIKHNGLLSSVPQLEKLYQAAIENEQKLAELEAKCASLAAENAGLNEKMDKLATWPGIEFYSSAWEFNNGDGNAALEFMCDSETPATDAFLAEVRAQGVEMFAIEWGGHYSPYGQDAYNFADKIRKGVQS